LGYEFGKGLTGIGLFHEVLTHQEAPVSGSTQ
jgi:hypothetical protein